MDVSNAVGMVKPLDPAPAVAICADVVDVKRVRTSMRAVVRYENELQDVRTFCFLVWFSILSSHAFLCVEGFTMVKLQCGGGGGVMAMWSVDMVPCDWSQDHG